MPVIFARFYTISLTVLPITGLLGLMAGCIMASGDKTDFDLVKSPSDLQGKYQNRGLSGNFNVSSSYLLSAILWPKEPMSHSAIETIEGTALDARSLVVRALSKDGIEKESIFSEGEHFQIQDGRIRLKEEVRMWRGTGDPLFGPTYERVELGIDQKRHGKYRHDGAGGGLVFMFLPFLYAARENVLFLRIEP